MHTNRKPLINQTCDYGLPEHISLSIPPNAADDATCIESAPHSIPVTTLRRKAEEFGLSWAVNKSETNMDRYKKVKNVAEWKKNHHQNTPRVRIYLYLNL